MTNAALSDPTSGRHYGMDWLRIFAFALLILYHVGMGFVPWDWHVKWPEQPDWLAYIMLGTNGWRLSLLFVVSGYASAALLAKLQVHAFMRSRCKRLLIPLVFAMIVVVPLQPWIELQFKHGYTGSFLHFIAQDYFRFAALEGIILPTWQHLWFVVYLFAYTLAAYLLALVLPQRMISRVGLTIGAALSGAGLLLIPPVFLLLRPVLFGGHADTHALVDDLPAHYTYFSMVLFGILLRHSQPLWSGIRAQWKIAAVITIVAYVAMIFLLVASPRPLPVAADLGYTILRVVQGWTAIIALLGIADRFWNRDHAARPMLNEAIFPFYIVHQTIIVAAIWVLLPSGMNTMWAFATVVAVTALGCWLFYRLGREISWLRPLIGLGPAKPKRDLAPLPA